MKRTGIERLLPEVFRSAIGEASPLAAILDVMEAMHAPSEALLDRLDECFDPRRADDRFIPLLSRWVDLDRLFIQSAVDDVDGASSALVATLQRQPISTGLGCLRELVARASELSQWRGTRRGLLAFLETATGEVGFEIDELVAASDGKPRQFHIRVVAPATTRAHRALVERIIESEKPAHVTHELQFASDGA
jgi:phage tail-like protein